MSNRSLTTDLRRWMRHQRVVDVSWVSGILLIAAAAAIMMPVSYRAGADRAHPHSVVQNMIDDLRGAPHHHDHGHDEAPPVRMSSLFAFDVPLAVSTVGLIEAGQPTSLHRQPFEAATTGDPDLPVIETIALGGDVAGAVSFLAALVAIVLYAIPDRRVWTTLPRLRGIVLSLEMPPPRLG